VYSNDEVDCAKDNILVRKHEGLLDRPHTDAACCHVDADRVPTRCNSKSICKSIETPGALEVNFRQAGLHFAFHMFLEHNRMWQSSVRPASATPY